MDLNSNIDKALGIISHAHEELKNGNLVVLKDFEDTVRAIQDEVAALKPTDAAALSEKLTHLADSLRQFEIDLRAMQIDVKYELMALNQKQKAAKSYQTTHYSGSDKKEGEE